MRPLRGTVTVALVAIAIAGCGAKTVDYQSVWSTTSSPAATAADTPVPIATYLESAGVTGSPVAPDKLNDLAVTLPAPKGWQQYSNSNLAPGTRVIAKGDTYPTAMLMVFRLDGDFDVAEAIGHADGDAKRSANFKQLNASTDDWRGFPSSMIEGTYDLNGQRMHSYNRIVIATGAPQPPATAGQRYLIQLTVTGYDIKATADAPDIEAIISGFAVAPKQ